MTKKQKIIFIISITLNLIVLGALLGKGMHWAYLGYKHKNSINYLKTIADKPKIKNKFYQLKGEVDDLKAVLMKEPFNREETKLAFKDLERNLIEVYQFINEEILDILEKLPPQDRIDFINRTLRPKFGPPRKGSSQKRSPSR